MTNDKEVFLSSLSARRMKVDNALRLILFFSCVGRKKKISSKRGLNSSSFRNAPLISRLSSTRLAMSRCMPASFSGEVQSKQNADSVQVTEHRTCITELGWQGTDGKGEGRQTDAFLAAT